MFFATNHLDSTELLTLLLQSSQERSLQTKQIQLRLNNELTTSSELLNFINNNKYQLNSLLRQERLRVDTETILIDKFNIKNVVQFYHFSYKVISLYQPKFMTVLTKQPDMTQLEDLFLSFFKASELVQREQQLKAIRKNKLHDKVPFYNLLLKWLFQHTRMLFQENFSKLYENIMKAKLQYQAILNKPEIRISPRIQSAQIQRPMTSLNKNRSVSNCTPPQFEFVRRKIQTPNRNTSIQNISSNSDILQLEGSFKHLVKQKEPNSALLYKNLLQRNAAIRESINLYQQKTRYKKNFSAVKTHAQR